MIFEWVRKSLPDNDYVHLPVSLSAPLFLSLFLSSLDQGKRPAFNAFDLYGS